jgi:putative N-acetylmannosamine-6-phosphate epimerase
MSQTHSQILESLKGGLIVSCQAYDDNPANAPHFMAMFAAAAEVGGAVGFRANGPADIAAIRAISHKPIIGIYKQREYSPVYITPTFASAQAVVAAGAEIVALDATHQARPNGVTPELLIEQIKTQLNCLVMADIDTFEEGVLAAKAGADIVATTMSGYTQRSSYISHAGPNLQLLAELAQYLTCPVICEGRIHTPEHLSAAFGAGAYAVVVGTAITNPTAITQKFVRAIGK